MEAISSREEEVSSRAAACSEAPWASDWLAEDTCVGGRGHLVRALVQSGNDAVNGPDDAPRQKESEESSQKHGATAKEKHEMAGSGRRLGARLPLL